MEEVEREPSLRLDGRRVKSVEMVFMNGEKEMFRGEGSGEIFHNIRCALREARK